MKRILLVLLVLAFAGMACRAQERMAATPTAVLVDTPSDRPTETQRNTPTASATQAQAERTQTATAAPISTFACAASPEIAALLEQTTAERWIDWVEKLSGAEPVIIAGKETVITTRYSPAMFSGQPNARALPFVHQTVAQWYPAEQIEVMDYTVEDPEGNKYTWQNLILTLPGTVRPEEIVILSAHLDSASETDPFEAAPGAEDNASGSAALLEAARLLAGVQFERTLQIIWFTGEEQGLLGSDRFVERLEDPEQVIGVLNLDMFGYDSDSDACFEMHVGTLPQSDAVGQCFVQSIEAYDLPLEQYDYLTTRATDRSDHGSFWEAEIGAIEILENMFDQNLPNGCPNGDMNEHYHTEGDTVDKLNPQSGVAIVRAALATIAAMAQPVTGSE